MWDPRAIIDSALDLGDDVKRVGDYPVGFGGYADVWRGVLRQERGETVEIAMKFLRFTTPNDKRLEEIAREVRIWTQLDHPNVLPFLGPSTRYGIHEICIISPWQSNGNVMTYLESCYTEDNSGSSIVLKMICDLMNGLAFLHSQTNPIVHGDLKGNNILVDEDGTAMLTDFGLSNIRDEVSATGTTSMVPGMSIPWTAPERIVHAGFSSLTPPSDMFSLGMTIYEILSGHKPFSGLSDVQAMLAIVEGRRPPTVSWRI